MQEKKIPAPAYVENDAEFKDIRCELFMDLTDESGDSDLTVRFSFPKDGSQPYMTLAMEGDSLGEIIIPSHHVAKVEAQLDRATALFRPYYDGDRAFPVDLEAALEAGVAHVQALTDARQAGTSMVEASTLLEDWAVAAADLLPDAPPAPDVISFPSLRLERDDVAVILDFEGEGASGDYDPTDSGDEPLMRVAVERRINDVWEFVEDSSYCTQISARASEAGKILAMSYILNGLSSEGSVKRHMERMSWIELTVADGDSPDFSRVPA
ncbi:hypothetical protein BAMBUS_00140 [Brevundimonas phage vB_BpoS-Bambus]|nr:hypothetical protein BAMBUS_00140 [Brevundimonas phage vB_BpoS-Bambus]